MLAELAEDTGSDFAQLIGFGPDLQIGFNWIDGKRDAGEMSAAVMALPSEVNYRVAAHLAFPEEAVLHEKHYGHVAARIPAQDYVQACRKYGIEHGCQTDLYEGPDGFIGLALLRSAQTGRTTARARRQFDAWRRKASTAVALQIALEREGFHVIAGTMEAMNAAAFVLDRQMQVQAFTPRAEESLAAGTLALEDGRLTRKGPAGAMLQKLLADVGVQRIAAGRVPLAARNGHGADVVQVHRLPAREWGFGFAPFAIAILNSPAPTPALPDAIEQLRAAFGLTRTEADIALRLTRGADRQTVGRDKGVSQETIRSHLRAIYAKMGVRREVDMVRLASELLR